VKPNRSRLIALVLTAILLAAGGCSDRTPSELESARGNMDPLVFDDGERYGENVYFQPFFETHYTAVSMDSVFAFNGFAGDGSRSLKFNIPPAGSALGPYTGGVLTATEGRDLADLTALTFYARADNPVTLDLIGFGNDNTGNSKFEASRANMALTTDWQAFIVPIPDPTKLRSEMGLLTFAEAPEEQLPAGYNIWLDEIKFAKVGGFTIFRPSMTSGTNQYFIGSEVAIGGTRTVFQNADGSYLPVTHQPGYFTYTSSNPAAVVVDEVPWGRIRVVAAGEAEITATVQDVPVLGKVTITGYEPPAATAGSPSRPQSDVVSLFSDVYVDHPVDTWRANWGGVTTQVQDYQVAGDNVKMYTSLNYVGIEFTTLLVDASQMTHFHMDVYTPEGVDFKVKLVSFPDGVTGVDGNELVFDGESTPPVVSGQWVSLDIPLEDFTPADEGWDLSSLGQLVLSATNTKLVLVDNIYFHK